jgi:hypothetical protein
MSFRLIPTPAPDSLPTGELLARELRRPGELHDAVAVGQHVAAVVSAKARASRVSPDLAWTLLLELRLLEDDLRAVGHGLPAPPAASSPDLRLSAAEASYLRALTFRRDVRRPECATRAIVPVRVLTRATSDAFTRAATGDLDHAICWETAAVAAGRTINELGLLLVLGTLAATS